MSGRHYPNNSSTSHAKQYGKRRHGQEIGGRRCQLKIGMKMSLFSKFLLSSAYLLVTTCSANTGVTSILQPTVVLDYDVGLKELNIRVKNGASVPIEIFDTLSEKEMPAFLSVQIQDKSGNILSKSDTWKDGFISSNIFISDAYFLPVELSLLQPGEELATQVKLNRILQGTEQYSSLNLKDLREFCLVFKITIYLNGNLTKFVDKKNDPFCN
jgi:hypothetical protein